MERASAGFQYSIFNSAPWLSGGKRHPRLRSKSKPGLLKADRRKQAEFVFLIGPVLTAPHGFHGRKQDSGAQKLISDKARL